MEGHDAVGSRLDKHGQCITEDYRLPLIASVRNLNFTLHLTRQVVARARR